MSDVVDIQAVRAERARTAQDALDRGRRALGRRAMSASELDRHLRDHGVEEGQRADVIEQLTSERAIDDDALAVDLAERLRRRKGMGPRAVRAELIRRGIEATAATAAGDDPDELQRAIDAATSRASRLRGLDPQTAKRRLAAWLQRRGYGGPTLSRALDAALE